MNVVCVGDCGVDYYRDTGERRFGGITANFARHARNEFSGEDRVAIVSCVGDDEAAELVLGSLSGTGIDCFVTRLPGTTPVQSIALGPDGERHFCGYDEGVLRRFCPDDRQRQLVAASDLLMTPHYQQIARLFEVLMSIETRGRIAVDFADFQQQPDFSLLERYIAQIDFGFFGLSPRQSESIERIRALAAQHDKILVVTLGAEGSLVFQGASHYRCAAAPASKVIDTTGAGDAYAAGFLARICRGAGIAEAMQHASRLASGVVGIEGAYYREP